jgi:ribulose-phosphate 3-epimerase
MDRTDTSFDRKHLKILPSIFAGDFGKLADEAKRIEQAGADGIHVDIMDGHFVPNLTLGPKALAAINKATDLFLDVHIMVYHPYDYVEKLIEAGADRTTFHIEATEDVEDTIAFIRKCGKQVGIALCPETSVSILINYLTKCDLVLLMTVNPGFGGQAFIPDVLEKIKTLRTMCNTLNLREGGVALETGKKSDLPPFEIQVDGGIQFETAKQCVEAGASSLVAGTYLFDDTMAEKISRMRNL